MLNKVDLRRAWHKLTTVQAINDRVTLKSGKPLHRTMFNVLALIAHHDGITIQGIMLHPYFFMTSLSTIKRSVTLLIQEGLITSTSSNEDKRENLLSIVEKY